MCVRLDAHRRNNLQRRDTRESLYSAEKSAAATAAANFFQRAKRRSVTNFSSGGPIKADNEPKKFSTSHNISRLSQPTPTTKVEIILVNVHGRACEIWDTDAKFGDVSEGAAGLVHAFIFFVNYEYLLHPRRAVFSPSECYDGGAKAFTCPAVSRKSHLSPNTNIFIDTRARSKFELMTHCCI